MGSPSRFGLGRPSSGGQLVKHPYIRFELYAQIVLQVHLYRGQCPGDDVVPALGETHSRPALPLLNRAGDLHRLVADFHDPSPSAQVHFQPGVKRASVVVSPLNIPLHRGKRITVLQAWTNRRDEPSHPLFFCQAKHLFQQYRAQALALMIRMHGDLNGTQCIRLKLFSKIPGALPQGPVPAFIRQGFDRSVPCQWDAVGDADDLGRALAKESELVVGEILEQPVPVVGGHRIVIHELGPDSLADGRDQLTVVGPVDGGDADQLALHPGVPNQLDAAGVNATSFADMSAAGYSAPRVAIASGSACVTRSPAAGRPTKIALMISWREAPEVTADFTWKGMPDSRPSAASTAR